MSQETNNKSFVASQNLIFITELYQKFLQNPENVDTSWQNFFNSKEFHQENLLEIQDAIKDYNGPSWSKRNLKIVNSDPYDSSSLSKIEPPKDQKQDKNTKILTAQNLTVNNSELLEIKAHNIIEAFRSFGHFLANTDPLQLKQATAVPQLDYSYHNISVEELNTEVDLSKSNNEDNKIFGKTTIGNLINQLNFIYCGNIGAEYNYINNRNIAEWLNINYIKTINSNIEANEKKQILKDIVRTERFEQFLHKRFPGAKRFSVEGGDSSINFVEKIITYGASNGIKKIVIGMAHRGRLNTLTGVMGKPYNQLFAEFKGTPGIPESVTKSGDVKYHMGYANCREINGNKIDISLAFNPSHLEAANSVVTGRIRAKQDLYQDQERNSAVALLIHGDAAFAGQGSVAENLMMNGIKGYDTGGVIHLIINNQIGFTANPCDSRSTLYASDLAKSIDAPIFHINGDDVEAVVKIANLAVEYRKKFNKDIVIDLICYRKYGHNEGDEPLYTQPVMYGKIKNHPSLEKIYSNKLLADAVITNNEYQQITNEFEAKLNSEFDLADKYQAKDADWLKKDWSKIQNLESEENIKTAITKVKAIELIEEITSLPKDFAVNPKILKQIESRKNQVTDGKEIDWGTAEALAFGSLLDEGFPVRITGQDSGRGTFSHRHSILHDANNANRYSVFSGFSNKAKYEVYDSILSEYAVLGFEYGYSLSMPNALTIWEAQFGDFANGAQIIFDQFIASSEVKWLRKSNLVMLLPHGYEGQGPEHSSARLERYLQACADNNLRVCNITTPANFFHALRRQLHSLDRKPLIVMSPKSLLRHKLAVSNIQEFSKNNFCTIIADNHKREDKKVKKVILCSGKIYYDLFEARAIDKTEESIAVIRLEQLYPFDNKAIVAELKKYNNAEIIWCQEEPRNMGAWSYINELIEEVATIAKYQKPKPLYVGRIACASPATGYGSYHAKEQKQIINQALSLNLNN